MARISPLLKHLADFVAKKQKINDEHFRHVIEADYLNEKREWTDHFAQFLYGMATNPLKSILYICEQLLHFDLTKKLKRIKIPTLVITGTKDTMLEKQFSEETAKKIPNSKLVEVSEGRHFIILEKPRQINKAIHEFLI